MKLSYTNHKEVRAAFKVEILASGLDEVVAGSRLLVVGPDDDEVQLREKAKSDLSGLLKSVDKSGKGVCVQASTLGSLEAMLKYLKIKNIPVSCINIGCVHKKDVIHYEENMKENRELACILCFDVPVDQDAEELAEEFDIHVIKGSLSHFYFLCNKYIQFS